MKSKTHFPSVRSLLIGAALIFLTGHGSFAQETLKISRVSKLYNVTIREGACSGRRRAISETDGDAHPARISIYRKGAGSPFQALCLPNVEIHKDQLAYNPETSGKRRVLYDDEYSLIFGDFNFDGQE